MEKGGVTPLCLFLCRWQPGRIEGPGLVIGRVSHSDWFVQQVRALEKLWKDGWGNLLPLSRSRDPFGRSLQAEDEKGGTRLPG